MRVLQYLLLIVGVGIVFLVLLRAALYKLLLVLDVPRKSASDSLVVYFNVLELQLSRLKSQDFIFLKFTGDLAFQGFQVLWGLVILGAEERGSC